MFEPPPLTLWLPVFNLLKKRQSVANRSRRVAVDRRKAFQYLQLQGVCLTERQFSNWLGSGKLCFEIRDGQLEFDQKHLEEVAMRYRKSQGRAYSVYRFDRDSGRWFEYVNSYQCAEMWCVSERQAQNIIASGKIPGVNVLRIGRENFVLREAAEGYKLKR